MSDVSEDALYEALVWAREWQATKGRTDMMYSGKVDAGTGSLLEAARWFRVNEYAGAEAWYCIDPDCEAAPDHHSPTCTVGRWVRAAQRAGL